MFFLPIYVTCCSNQKLVTPASMGRRRLRVRVAARIVARTAKRPRGPFASAAGAIIEIRTAPGI
jgi:hypothetical protein